MHYNKHRLYWPAIFIVTLLLNDNCSKSNAVQGAAPVAPTPVTAPVAIDSWLTYGDQSVLLQKQATQLSFNNAPNTNAFIDIDSTITYQPVDGFGYTLTGGSATLINQLNATDKASLLQELFGNAANSISLSYLRISIGASDLNANTFSYDDITNGQTDTLLNNFSLNNDKTDLIPLLKQIIQVNPNIKILGSPWSAPVWMKDNNSTIGGSLQPQYYKVYAQYFIKYIQQMKAEGITIDAVTLQNEPLNPNNNPSMVMTAQQQTDFIKNYVGPAFKAANITTKIITYDHNCDQPGYPLTVLNDVVANSFVDGSAFHLYAGDISALTTIHNAFPTKQVYFTEQYTASTGDFAGDLKWHVKNVVIGSMRNWSRNALEWNLANDVSYGPHTIGGCTTCKGALVISSGVSRNVGYYIIAHASKFVPAGSVRIYSNLSGNIQDVAFLTPNGQKVLIVENDGSTAASFNIRYKSNWAPAVLPAGAVATYVWQ
jgi:glucosylceramidase